MKPSVVGDDWLGNQQLSQHPRRRIVRSITKLCRPGFHRRARRARNVMDIAGSVALVTGGNRGFGASMCASLLERGAAKVYAGARDVSTVRMDGVEAVRLDITSADDIAAAARHCA